MNNRQKLIFQADDILYSKKYNDIDFSSESGYKLRPKIIKPQHVSIIGGGIASACAAYALTKQGIKVTLYCKDNALAQGASSNAIAALYPLLHQQADDISLFYQEAFWRAKSLYTEISQQGFDFPHSWCGLLELAYKESLVKRQKKFNELATWPTDLIHKVDAKQASQIANITLGNGGLFMPNAGWIAPQELVKQVINAAKATGRLTIKTDVLVNTIEQIQPIENKTQKEEAEKEKRTGDYPLTKVILMPVFWWYVVVQKLLTSTLSSNCPLLQYKGK